jgi:hypothetical protein
VARLHHGNELDLEKCFGGSYFSNIVLKRNIIYKKIDTNAPQPSALHRLAGSHLRRPSSSFPPAAAPSPRLASVPDRLRLSERAHRRWALRGGPTSPPPAPENRRPVRRTIGGASAVLRCRLAGSRRRCRRRISTTSSLPRRTASSPSTRTPPLAASR